MSKVIPDCIGFALLRSVIGPENSRHSLNQSDAKQLTMTTWSPVFSRSLGSSLGFSASSPFFFAVFSFVCLGEVITSVFVVGHLIEKRSKLVVFSILLTALCVRP